MISVSGHHLPATPMPSVYTLAWAYLALGVGIASLWSPGPDHHVSFLLIVGGFSLAAAFVRRSRWLTTFGLSVVGVSGLVRGTIIMFFGDHLAIHSRVVAFVVWTTISLWAIMRVRTSAIAGVKWTDGS